jgi:hypothetical protein
VDVLDTAPASRSAFVMEPSISTFDIESPFYCCSVFLRFGQTPTTVSEYIKIWKCVDLFQKTRNVISQIFVHDIDKCPENSTSHQNSINVDDEFEHVIV